MSSTHSSAVPERFWDDARAKVDREGRCRLCPQIHSLDAAHVYKRAIDKAIGQLAYEGSIVEAAVSLGCSASTLYVDPRDVVPLCRSCHRDYDTLKVDLLPVLTLVEQARIVSHVGIERALHRTAPVSWPRA